MVMKPAFSPLLAQILFNQCNVTGLGARLRQELQIKQVRICMVLLEVQYDLWNIAAQHRVAGIFSNLKADLENKQYVIATYFYLRE